MDLFKLFRKKPVPLRVPLLGDLVYWAPKKVRGIVSGREGNVIIFQGGEIIQNKRGREVPRWTVSSRSENFVRRDDLGLWIIGQGETPKLVNGVVVYPEPVALSGSSVGSFAVGG